MATTWVVVTKGGVAYRNTAKYTDRVTTFRGPEFGQEVEALGDARTGVDEGVTWIQTAKGWIPIRTLDGNEVIKRKEHLTKSDIAMIKRSNDEDDLEEGRGRSSSVVDKADLWLTALEDEEQTDALEDTALVVGAGGLVQAIQHSGEPLWTVEGELKPEKCVSLLSRAPIYGGIKAVYAAAHGVLLAISATDGNLIWRADLSQLYKGPCTLALDFAGERLFCASQGRVMGLCANTGRALWTANLTRTGYDVVSVLTCKLAGLKDAEQLFCASRGRVFCFSGVKGKVRWTTTMKLSAKCFMCLATHEDRVQNRSRLLFSTHGRVGALDTVTGRVIWEVRVPKLKKHYTLAPIVLDDDVMFVCVAGNVLAIFAKTGQQKWERDLFGSEMLETEQGAVCMDRPKKMIYIALCQHVVALDTSDGEIKWSVYVPQIRCTQPCLYLAFDDLLYVSGAGHVRCVDTLTGNLAQGFDPELGAEMTTTGLFMTHPTQGNQDHNVNPVPQSWGINKAVPHISVRDFGDESKRFAVFLGDMKREHHKAAPQARAEAAGSEEEDEEGDESDEDILQQIPSQAVSTPKSPGHRVMRNISRQAPPAEESSEEDNYDDEEDPFAMDFVPTKKSPKQKAAQQGFSSDEEPGALPEEITIAPEYDSSEDEDPFAHPSQKQSKAVVHAAAAPAAAPSMDLQDDLMSLMVLTQQQEPVSMETQPAASQDLMGFAAAPQPAVVAAEPQPALDVSVPDDGDPFALAPPPAPAPAAPAMAAAPMAPAAAPAMASSLMPAPAAAQFLQPGAPTSPASGFASQPMQPMMPMSASPFSTQPQQPMMPQHRASPFLTQPQQPPMQQGVFGAPRQASPFAAPQMMQPQASLMQPSAAANPFAQRPAASLQPAAAAPAPAPAPARPNPFGSLVASQKAGMGSSGIPSHMPSTPRLGLFQQ